MARSFIPSSNQHFEHILYARHGDKVVTKNETAPVLILVWKADSKQVCNQANLIAIKYYARKIMQDNRIEDYGMGDSGETV